MTRAEILRAAAEVFSDKGYGLATINDIVDRLGITKGALYHHWKSKEELALELAELVSADYFRIVEPRIERAASTWERIEALLEVASELGDRASDWPYRNLWVALSFCLPADATRLRAKTEQDNRDYVAFWTQTIREAQGEGAARADMDAAASAETVVNALFGYQILAHSNALSHSHREMTRNLLEFLKAPPPCP